jgi:hypothetical protein
MKKLLALLALGTSLAAAASKATGILKTAPGLD